MRNDTNRIASITKHWMCNSLTYRSWLSMKQRCLNKNHAAYNRYWWRWIIVCDRWKESFENFYSDLWERKNVLMTLDRKDTNGNYEPWNCKWSTKKEQSANTRKTRFYRWKKILEISEKLWIHHTQLYSLLWKYNYKKIKLIKKYWRNAVAQKDKDWNIIQIYKDARHANNETWILFSSICKCCRKEPSAITAWWFMWDFVLTKKNKK